MAAQPFVRLCLVSTPVHQHNLVSHSLQDLEINHFQFLLAAMLGMGFEYLSGQMQQQGTEVLVMLETGVGEVTTS